MAQLNRYEAASSTARHEPLAGATSFPASFTQLPSEPDFFTSSEPLAGRRRTAPSTPVAGRAGTGACPIGANLRPPGTRFYNLVPMDIMPILQQKWESLLGMLPLGFDLEKTLRQSGALLRRRAIQSAETLLRLVLVYSLCGLSLRATAAWAQAQGLANLSDVALLKRLRQAAPWMGQMLAAKLGKGSRG